MIIKGKEFKSKKNHLQKLGYDAEKQMAFYLKRHFGESNKFFVFNDLKITHNGETCQIDHLVLTTTGFFIIESKSCVGQISYDEKDQWIRHTPKRDYGMQSPIQQTELQIKILKAFLQNEAIKDKNLLGTLMGIAQGFGARPYIKVIAIADNTIIKHPEEANPNVLKADAVCDFISSHQRGIMSTLLSDDIGFSSKQVNNIVELLKSGKKESITRPVVEDFKLDNFSGKRIEYGRYGYYFKHEDGKNESIKEKCKNCGGKTKIRKDKEEFFSTCLLCNKEILYWKNNN